MDKVKNFEEHMNEGLFNHADWVDLDLLQGTIERMRSEEYKKSLIDLNSNFPINSKVKFGFDTVERDTPETPETTETPDEE